MNIMPAQHRPAVPSKSTNFGKKMGCALSSAISCKFASTSNMCFYKVLLFTQNYILFYSLNLCDSNAHGFVLNGAVSIELYTIYHVSISEPSKLPVLVIKVSKKRYF